jgi:hypothetical protein
MPGIIKDIPLHYIGRLLLIIEITFCVHSVLTKLLFGRVFVTFNAPGELAGGSGDFGSWVE